MPEQDITLTSAWERLLEQIREEEALRRQHDEEVLRTYREMRAMWYRQVASLDPEEGPVTRALKAGRRAA